MNKKEILEYWLKSADIDYKTMQYLFKGKDYSWSLFTLTSFNIKARYDDYKLKFHRICTRKFADEYVGKIKEFRTWIKREL